MKRLFFLAALIIPSLMACQPSETEKTDGAVLPPATTEEAVSVKAGAVRLRLKTPVSEQFACISYRSRR